MTTTAPHARPTPLAWLPLAVLATLLSLSAVFGYGGLARDANAASSTIEVNGTVTKAVYLDATGCAAASDLDIGDLVPADPWKQTTSDCSILFGSTNSAAGADLTVLEDPAAPASPTGAMKCINMPICGVGGHDGELDDVAANSAPPAGATSAFGAQLTSATGLASNAWTVGNAYPVAGGSTACQTAAIGDGTCDFRFGASADVSDGAGAYQALVQFLVLAR